MNTSDLRQVELVAPEELYALRRRVLRGNDPAVSVQDPRDHDDSAQHYALRRDGDIVASGSFYPSHSVLDASRDAYQLRYLATSPDVQGQRYGTVLLRAAESRLSSAGVSEVWANGRDTAWGFYERNGWSQQPDSQHLSKETGLAHTVIYKSLRSSEPCTVEFADERDASTLASLREEMYFSVHLCETPQRWVRETERYFLDGFADGSIIAAVARRLDGEAVSLAAATLRSSVPSPRFALGAGAYIHSVSTRPAFRHRGLSRALMEMLLGDLRNRGLEFVELHASWQGEGLYRSLGFADRTNGKELRIALRDEEDHALA